LRSNREKSVVSKILKMIAGTAIWPTNLKNKDASDRLKIFFVPIQSPRKKIEATGTTEEIKASKI
jgi:hypothetical protein